MFYKCMLIEVLYVCLKQMSHIFSCDISHAVLLTEAIITITVKV